MNIAQLIERLQQYPQDMEIMIKERGFVLDLNVGPYDHTITEGDEDDCGDCEGRVGETVVVIGGGSY